MAERHDLIARLFADTTVSPAGCYCIRLFLDGEWQSVIVDDRLPCSSQPRRPEQVADTGLAFSRAASSQLWVCLLEKAYAKAHGSFNAISGGEIAEALLDLTGAPTYTISFDHAGFSVERLWSLLLRCKAEQLPMGCATDSDPTGQLREVGLCPTHAYSILECREVRRGAEMVRLLRIRNPHGVLDLGSILTASSEFPGTIPPPTRQPAHKPRMVCPSDCRFHVCRMLIDMLAIQWCARSPLQVSASGTATGATTRRRGAGWWRRPTAAVSPGPAWTMARSGWS